MLSAYYYPSRFHREGLTPRIPSVDGGCAWFGCSPTCFKSLLDYYKESGQKQKYTELYGLMKRIVFKTEGISDEKRKQYHDEIDR